MIRHLKPFALLLAIMLCVCTVVAQDGSTTQPSDRSDGARPTRARSRLVQPWSKLATLTEEQKQQIMEIHAQAVDAINEIRDKEEADIMSLLTEEQKAELQELKEKERAEQKARRSERKDKGAGGSPDGDKGTGRN